MTFTNRNGVSVAEIIIYIPILVVGVVLAVRHGFRQSSGWVFVVIFSLARIIGPCFQLATIHDPTNTDLYTGTAILQNIGLSPLMLAALGLLSRVISSINKRHRNFPDTRMLKVLHLIVTIALILGIVGGIDSSDKLKDTGTYVPQSKSKVGVALFIVAYVLLFLSTILTSFNVSHCDPGEKRLLVAVALSLPFLLVRVIYSSLSTFDTGSKTFNLVSGNVTVWIIMALIMELIIVIIFEGTGLTLRRFEEEHGLTNAAAGSLDQAPGQGFQPQAWPPGQWNSAQPQEQQASYGNGAPTKGRNVLQTLGQRTIIGRLVRKVFNKGDDVEMQQQEQRPSGWQ